MYVCVWRRHTVVQFICELKRWFCSVAMQNVAQWTLEVHCNSYEYYSVVLLKVVYSKLVAASWHRARQQVVSAAVASSSLAEYDSCIGFPSQLLHSTCSTYVMTLRSLSSLQYTRLESNWQGIWWMSILMTFPTHRTWALIPGTQCCDPKPPGWRHAFQQISPDAWSVIDTESWIHIHIGEHR